MRYSRILSILAFALFAGGIFWGSYTYFKAQELEKAAARLTLYRNTLEAELRHFAHLPFLLSLDPLVAEALAGGDAARLNKRLARFSQSAGVDAIFLMNRDGLTISASNAQTAGSFVGQNYGFRPYFQAALRGELGEFYGIGATTGVPGYFYAMAVGSAQTRIAGVIAIKVDLSPLQESWQASGERIILSNADGVVLLASEPEWRYRALSPLNDEQRQRIGEARQFGKESLAPLNWAPDLRGQTAALDRQRFLYLRTGDLPNAWVLHFFSPDDQAVARAWLTTGALVVFSGLVFIAWQLRRVRQIGAALARSEHEEAELRQANERLAVEIEERRLAERNLKKTQVELEQAGRLAALGRLASSVTHELGQPIAAMRNQLAAAEISTGETKLNTKMQSLVARMEDITRQLKFFSRKGRDQFEVVDLRDVIDGSLELASPSVSDAEADLHFHKPDVPFSLIGNRMRLEQVVTNLVRNAFDAVEEADEKRIDIHLGETAETIWFEVIDTGHGLGGKTMMDLKEPFATTKESGRGMGLGLTISAGIVADHGGELTAEDHARCGAVFRATFPKGATT